MRKSPTFEETIICQNCGAEAKRSGPVQKYCRPCSEAKDLERKRVFAGKHPPSQQTRQRSQINRMSAMRQRGQEVSAGSVTGIDWMDQEHGSPLWSVRVAFPFTWAMSKNHLWSLAAKGHVHLREDSVTAHDGLVALLNTALVGRRLVQAKVWIDLFVQKPNHKGDAVNLVDFIADAIKVSTGIDDRWYSIRRLDWEIVKENPQIYVGISQETDEDHQVCSYCGRILPFNMFNKTSAQKSGVGRECHDCRKKN